MRFSKAYARFFSRGLLAKANDRLLSYSLRARGYNNYQSNQLSGESFFVRHVLAPTNPSLCLDVGANTGAYTAELLANTRARVICFEPLPSSFLALAETTAGHSERVTLENKGLGAQTGAATIHFNPDALAHASFSEQVKKVPYVSNQQQTTVRVVTLDEYCSENGIEEIDLVKIDTEGFETEVFEGARETFSKVRPKFVQIEFNWHQLFRNVSLNHFAEKLPNYAVYQLIPNGWARRDPTDPLSNIYYFSNFVFVRPD